MIKNQFWWGRHLACPVYERRQDACATKRKKTKVFSFLLQLDSRFRGNDATVTGFWVTLWFFLNRLFQPKRTAAALS